MQGDEKPLYENLVDSSRRQPSTSESPSGHQSTELRAVERPAKQPQPYVYILTF